MCTCFVLLIHTYTVNHCYEVKADVVVVGVRGLGHGIVQNLKDSIAHNVLAGSTADYVLHHAPCEVLCVKAEHEY